MNAKSLACLFMALACSVSAAPTLTLLSYKTGTPGTAADKASLLPLISSDGVYMTFTSNATDLVAGFTDNNDPQVANSNDIFQRNLQTGAVTLVSHATGSLTAGMNHRYTGVPRASSDGRFVIFASDATDLVTGVGGAQRPYFWDRTTGTVTFIANVQAQGVAISGDGNWFGIYASSSNMPKNIYNSGQGTYGATSYTPVYLIHRATGAVTLVSHEPGNVDSIAPVDVQSIFLSDDGRYAAFESAQHDGWDTYTGTFTANSEALYLYDRLADSMSLVTKRNDGAAPATQVLNPAIQFLSGDGRYLYFIHADINFGTVSADSNSVFDIYRYDRDGGSTRLSRFFFDNYPLSPVPSAPTTAVHMSPNNRYVAFLSSATDLVAGDTNGRSDVFRYDTSAALLERVNVNSDGSEWTPAANGTFAVGGPRVDDQGRVSFQTNATAIGFTDGNSGNDLIWASFGAVVVVPTVASPTSSALTYNSATLGGNVTATGGADATARGVVYALTAQNSNPEIGGANVTVLSEPGTFSTGAFTRSATGLAASSGYSFKAYATNSAGTSYSSVGTFSTPGVPLLATIIFSSSAGITGTSVTDGQGGSTDVSGLTLQFSAKDADGLTDLPMTYEPGIYPGINGIAGGYAASSIQSVFTIKSSSQTTNFTMNSILLADYGGVAGDQLRIEAFDDGVSAGFINVQVSGEPWYATVDLASLGGATFVDIDEVRITPVGGADMFIAVNNITVSDISGGTPTVAVSSLNRANATPSNSATVNWTLTFGSAVTGVSASNFTLSGAGATGASIGAPSTGNGGLSWNVPVTTGSDGILTLNLANATGLSAAISTTLPYVGQSYTMDKTPPDTTITVNPASLTTSTSASFEFTGADTGGTGVEGFEVSLDAGGYASGTSPQNYSSLADGSHTFRVRAVDAAGNADSTPATYTWTVDTTPPQVVSVARLSPLGQTVSAATVVFRVTYSEPVLLNAPETARFAVVPVNGGTVTATVTSVTGTGATRDVTVNITGGAGEFRLRVVD